MLPMEAFFGIMCVAYFASELAAACSLQALQAHAYREEKRHMTQAWVTLTRADGRDIASPSDQQLATALTELYRQSIPGASPADLASAVLRFGYDDGLMYVAEVNCAGDISFEEWSDSDCELALAAPRRMKGSQEQAQELWMMMSRRQVSKIRALAWHSGS